MTKNQLKKRIEWWQQTLDHMAITHWRIESIEINDAPNDDANCDACIHVSRQYDSCWFEFREAFLKEAPEFEIDRVIVHEWLHAAFRSYDRHVFYSIQDMLAPPVYDQWRTAVTDEGENIIERLARQLTHAYSPYVVQ